MKNVTTIVLAVAVVAICGYEVHRIVTRAPATHCTLLFKQGQSIGGVEMATDLYTCQQAKEEGRRDVH